MTIRLSHSPKHTAFTYLRLLGLNVATIMTVMKHFSHIHSLFCCISITQVYVLPAPSKDQRNVLSQQKTARKAAEAPAKLAQLARESERAALLRYSLPNPGQVAEVEDSGNVVLGVCLEVSQDSKTFSVQIADGRVLAVKRPQLVHAWETIARGNVTPQSLADLETRYQEFKADSQRFTLAAAALEKVALQMVRKFSDMIV